MSPDQRSVEAIESVLAHVATLRGVSFRAEGICSGLVDPDSERQAAAIGIDLSIRVGPRNSGAERWTRDENGISGSLDDVSLRLEKGKPPEISMPPELSEESFRALELFVHLAVAWDAAGRQRATIHGCAFQAGDGRGVLAIGPSGTGKSTLSVAAALAGARVVTDDFVQLGFLGSQDDRPVAAWLRRDMYVEELDLPLGQRPFQPGPEDGMQRFGSKLRVRRAGNPDLFIDQTTVSEVWVLRRSVPTINTEIRPATKSAAFAALLQASLPLISVFERGELSREILGILRRTADGVACREVHLGEDLMREPGPSAVRLLASSK